jgi:hypothetical protein
MIRRAIDNEGDWLFGKGKNDYVSASTCVGQAIQTRLASFLGDCFFARAEGIDWFNLLGGKNLLGLELAIRATIADTPNVTSLLEVSSNLTDTRLLTVSFKVQTAFGPVDQLFQYDLGA